MHRVLEAVASGLEAVANGNMNSRRFFHGRGHCYKGLEVVNVDFHPGVLLVTLYQPLADEDERILVEGLKVFTALAVMIQRRYLPKAPSELISGQVPSELIARTDDMRFDIKLGVNQNSGYFLDMQPVHQWLRLRAQGKQLLNLFSYTCAFSVAAIKGGANRVVNVDMSAGVLKTGQRNHAINDLDPRAARFMKLDILKSWGRIKKTGPFDLLVIDPPSNQRGSFVAEQDYGKVLRRIPQLLGDSGEVLACLNAPHLSEDYLIDLMAQECPQCQLLERLPPSADFPETDANRSLKVLLFSYRS